MEALVSKEGLDPEWDSFLATLPDGLYQQSSLWAQVKAGEGWKHLRVVIREQGKIIGGAQMLLRPLPLFGTVGYVSKGPVVASDDPAIQDLVLDQLDRIAIREHVLFLKVQPANGTDTLAQRLVKRGAQPSAIRVTPLTTLRVDLRLKPEDILARMNRVTRNNIGRSERKGVVPRLGTEADIPTFIHLERIHAQQRGYNPGTGDYYYHLWSSLAAGGYYGFLLAEYEGQALAAHSFIAFGDTMFDYHLVDNGLHKDLNAQTLLHWKTMLWGKEHGFAWYDFGGIDLQVAKTIVNGEPTPDTRAGRVAKFKQSFGGQVMFRPGVYDVSYVWPNRLTIKMIPMLIRMKPILNALIGGSLAGYVRMHDEATREMAATIGDHDG